MKKEFIVSEIKRTAEENGGTPLGWTRFARETGCREADWFAKYWNNWGDALEEAGFERNRLTTAYGEELLLLKLAQLIDSMGKFPVKADLIRASHEREGFPSYGSFRRLGRKAELASKLLVWCELRPEYENVARICRPIARELSTEATDEDNHNKEEYGFVYLAKSGRHYKIGRTNSPGRREYELGIILPEGLKQVHVIKTDDPVGIEQYWHKRFSEKRGNGEWFDLTKEDISAFKRRSFM